MLNSLFGAMRSELDPSLSEQLLQLLLQSRVGSSQAIHYLGRPHKILLDPLGRPACQTHAEAERLGTQNTGIYLFLCLYLTITATRILSQLVFVTHHYVCVPQHIHQKKHMEKKNNNVANI